jgi:hypothetical protein
MQGEQGYADNLHCAFKILYWPNLYSLTFSKFKPYLWVTNNFATQNNG